MIMIPASEESRPDSVNATIFSSRVRIPENSAPVSLSPTAVRLWPSTV